MGTLSTTKVILPNGQEILGASVLFLKSALSLETKGLKRRDESAFSATKRIFMFKGNKVAVLEQLETWVNKNMFPQKN